MNGPEDVEKAISIEVLTVNSTGEYESGFGPLSCCKILSEEISKTYPGTLLTPCSTLVELEALVQRQPDLVVLASKYIRHNGNRIILSDYLSSRGIPFTGSHHSALEYDSKKSKAKVLAKNMGIATTKYVLESQRLLNCPKKAINLGFPLFVKPDGAANSSGITHSSVVWNEDQYVDQVNKLLARHGEGVIAEKYLPGREFTVGVLESTGLKLEIYPVEIMAKPDTKPGSSLTQSVKLKNTEILRPITDGKTRRILSYNSKRLFREMNASGLARFDFKMDKKNRCHFLEVNLIPGMNPESSYLPRACKVDQNLSYSDLIQNLITSALSHQPPRKTEYIPEQRPGGLIVKTLCKV